MTTKTVAFRIICPREGLAHEFDSVEAAVAALRDPTGPINFLEPGERHDLIRALEALATPPLKSSAKVLKLGDRMRTVPMDNRKEPEGVLGANYVSSLDAAQLRASGLDALPTDDHGPHASKPAAKTTAIGDNVRSFLKTHRARLDDLESMVSSVEAVGSEDGFDEFLTSATMALLLDTAGPELGRDIEALRISSKVLLERLMASLQ